jgi:hypothetical protein
MSIFKTKYKIYKKRCLIYDDWALVEDVPILSSRMVFCTGALQFFLSKLILFIRLLYGRRDPSRWPRGTLYLQTLAITSPTSGGRLVDVVRSRTQTMEFLVLVCLGSPDHGTCLYTADSTDPLTYTVVTLYIFCVHFTWRWPPIGAETCCK